MKPFSGNPINEIVEERWILYWRRPGSLLISPWKVCLTEKLAEKGSPQTKNCCLHCSAYCLFCLYASVSIWNRWKPPFSLLTSKPEIWAQLIVIAAIINNTYDHDYNAIYWECCKERTQAIDNGNQTPWDARNLLAIPASSTRFQTEPHQW
jgi:hypothetical protein